MIISASQFLAEVTEIGFSCWQPRDKEIFCPSEDWLREFGSYLLQTRVQSARESWDCDDYALHAVVEASVACRAAALGTGHSFVYCTLKMFGQLNGIDAEWGSGHAGNLVRLDSGSYVFFEPQTGQFCNAKTAIFNGLAIPFAALL